MALEMRHLKLVAAIAEEGSVSRAGTRLHLTQSALSHQLRDAEELLGRPLFERRSRKMILTAAGERLLRSARAVIDELDQAEREIQRSTTETRGTLRLTTQCYTAYHWLPSRLKRFQKKYPGVEVHLAPEATSNPFEALLAEKLDLAIAHAPIRNRKIEYTPLFRDEMVVIVAPGHPWAAKAFVSAEDFAAEDLIIYPPKSESSILLKFLNPARVVPRRIREVLLTEAIVALVKERMGVAVVTRWSVGPHLANGELAAVRMTRDGFYREWSAARLRSKSAPAYLEEFIRLLAQNPMHIPDTKPRRPHLARHSVDASPPRSSAAKRKSRIGRP
jgi:LysR family transcriptional regulator, regulator for metE and metH